MKITVLPTIGPLTQQTLCFSPDVLARGNKTSITTMSVASDRGHLRRNDWQCRWGRSIRSAFFRDPPLPLHPFGQRQQFPTVFPPVFLQCCFTSTETVGNVRDWSPGPPLSHSSWAVLRETVRTIRDGPGRPPRFLPSSRAQGSSEHGA